MIAPSASAHTHVGTPLPGYHQEWVKHTIHWHGFVSLSTVRGAFVYSPEFMLLGNPWRLELFPGGDTLSAEGMVSLGLANRSDKAIEIDYGFGVNDENGKQVAYNRSATPRNFGPVGGADGDDYWGFTNFATRLPLLSSLINGTLIIEVHVRLATPTKSVPPIFIPENPFAKNIKRMIIDENFGDISFAVGGNQKKKKMPRKLPRRHQPCFMLIGISCESVQLVYSPTFVT
jgi:hypothetical protein